MKKFLIAVVVLVLAVYAVFQLPQFGGRFEGDRLRRMRRSPQFIDGRFQNTPPQDTESSLLETWRLYRQGQVREPRFAIPVVPLSPAALAAPAAPGLRAIWFGHASVLVEIDGVRIMTDPVLSRVVSPIPIGPERFHRPPIALEQLAHIDAVVISHDHYDHLDMKTVQQLAPRGTHFFVPLGVGAHLERWNVPAAQIHEMDWWEAIPWKGVVIHCTPARHYSGRKRMDNSTLWSSWAIRGPRHSVYYSGDTGYAPHFAEIRRRVGPTDLALIKVGAYGETWLDIHMDPESAVQAHTDLEAATLLPVHWATFNLSYHAWDEPIRRTLAAAAKKNVHVVTPRIGERYEHGRPFRNVAWYGL
ncbi:MAG TPA: MBL fold metallo-hydrolase [Thermoanaerobaculia bacterium]|nr:MBL fold metallo-hydrolase [Thermoanaerobaculia bacterium]